MNFIGGRRVLGVWAQNLSAGRPRGVQRVAREVAENLLDDNNTVYLAVTKISFEYGLVSIYCMPLMAYLHAIPYQTTDDERSARVSSYNPIILPGSSIAAILSFECFESIWDWPLATMGLRVVGVVHDLIPFRIEENVEYENKNRYFRSLGNMIDRASYVVSVSKATENDLLSVFPSAAGKSVVISNAFGRLAETQQLTTASASSDLRTTITMIGTVEIRKNHLAVMRSIPKIATKLDKRLRFLIIGDNSGSSDIFGGVYKYALDHAINFAEIEFTGFVDDATIQDHLSQTDILVFPSLWEGFGMPILEALAYGIPVVASNTSSHVEVGGDVISYCDPYDVGDISDTILSVLSLAPDKKRDLIEKGRDWTRHFTWEKSASHYNTLLQSISGACANPGDLLPGQGKNIDQVASITVPWAVRLVARYGSPWKAWVHLGGKRLTVARFNACLNDAELDNIAPTGSDVDLASKFLRLMSSITKTRASAETTTETSRIWSWSVALIIEEIIDYRLSGRQPPRSITRNALAEGFDQVVDQLGVSLLGEHDHSTFRSVICTVSHADTQHMHRPNFVKLSSAYAHMQLPCPVSKFEIVGIQDLDECVSAAICKHNWADLRRGWMTNATEQILRLQMIDSFDAIVPAGEIWSPFKLKAQDLDVKFRTTLRKFGLSSIIAGGTGFTPAQEYYATGECESVGPLFAASRYALIPLRDDESLCEIFNNHALRALSEGLVTLAPRFFVDRLFLDHPEIDTGWLIPYSDLSDAISYIAADDSNLSPIIDERVQKARAAIGLTTESRSVIDDISRLLSRAVHREIETDLDDASVFIKRAEDIYGIEAVQYLKAVFRQALFDNKSALILKTDHTTFSSISNGFLDNLKCLVVLPSAPDGVEA